MNIWLVILLVCIAVFLHSNRETIGRILAVADDVLGAYNDQYDHGPPPEEEEVKKES